MPSPHPVLSQADARLHAAAAGFDTDSPTGVGLELEWLVVRRDDPEALVSFADIRAAACTGGPLTGGSRITFEPGGQVELSAPRMPTPSEAITIAATDATELLARLGAAGLGAVALGLDPARPRRQVLESPRYRAMAEYFRSGGSAGASMMCATAALQVNVGLGAGPGTASRWQLAHDLGPVLAAAFAHSPICGRRPSGWRSTRLAVWSAIDPSRTLPVATEGDDPRAAWAEFALAARVMLIRTDEDRYVVPREPMTFADWIRDGHPLGHPTAQDLSYHLTTLFPPVRPRGWLELRMLDALPDPWWRVAAGVTSTLLADDAAGDAVRPALRATRGRWLDAALHATRDPSLVAAALACFDVALSVMPGGGVDDSTLDATREYRDRYVARGRTPADDRLDGWASRGALLPDPEPVPVLSWT